LTSNNRALLSPPPPPNDEVQARTAFLVYRSQLETDHQRLSGCRAIVLDANVLLDKNLSVFLIGGKTQG
jgi:hypothetical protein